MPAYHADPALRADTLARMREHARLDQITQGTYAKGTGADFRGCLVGCAIHDEPPEGRHAAFPRVFGIPEILARLADRIFEGLTPAEAKLLPVAFFTAIPCGADLSLAWPRFALALMVDPDHGVARLTADGSAPRRAIDAVAALFARQIAGDTILREEWVEARRDAAYAADTAAYAYAAAAAYAAATTTTAAADTAADAADAAAAYAAAAYAAYAAYDAATRSAHYAWQASTLLAILASCPVVP